jgi:hypothetical protein
MCNRRRRFQRLFPDRHLWVDPLVALPSPGHIRRQPNCHLHIWLSVARRCGLVSHPHDRRRRTQGGWQFRRMSYRRRQVERWRANGVLRHARFHSDLNGVRHACFLGNLLSTGVKFHGDEADAAGVD